MEDERGRLPLDIYLMRHGRSLADEEGRIESRYDSPLTKAGVEAARSAGERFLEGGVSFDCIITSELRRARRTGEILRDMLRVGRLEQSPLLNEVDRGLLCGLEREEADARYPAPAFRGRFARYPGDSGESQCEARSRALLAVRAIVCLGLESVLVVSHGGILNEIVGAIMNIPSSSDGRSGAFFSFGNCGYARLQYRPDRDSWFLLEFCR
jgi:broad specificity phosphatase PhoE